MKEYVFFKHRAGDKAPTRITKTEDELTKQDKRLMLGQLMHMWENTAPDVKLEFLTKVV